ncbi:hypothetical protein FCM35_KLT10111 [Carex littledalei]|uniref:Uncharacterized protein n=1 Tax=Carex littledalei TaxID=544730 RepID=A0A833RI66_9POAL|nr:hypothetical protein FCM35_KLT10111 [Carex littledalei]
MAHLSTNPSTIFPASPPLLPRATTKLASFSLLRFSLTSKPFPLRLHNFTPLSPSPPLLPPPRATYDIPISIKSEEYETFLDLELWKGAIVYKRDASVSHVEYCTSLHRLILGWYSSRVSADRAAEMGLKLPDDLKWPSFDDEEDEDEDEDDEDEDEDDEDGDEDEDEDSSGELNKQDVAIRGVDENGNPVSLSYDELKDAEVSVKYDNEDHSDASVDDEDEDDKLDDALMDTPVALSIDVTRRKGRIRLDGILRTVIALDCHKCLASSARCVYLNFSILLSEQPVGESPDDDLDTVEELFDEAKTNKIMFERKGAYGDEDHDIEWDDRLYFPPGEKEIDISKHVRDFIHLEVTRNILCSPNCKGVCLMCSTNLNVGNCTCEKVEGEEGEEESWGTVVNDGPLKGLRKKLEKNLDQ